MGRGRQKAKQQKIARKLKYMTTDTDYDELAKELGAHEPGSAHSIHLPMSRTTNSRHRTSTRRWMTSTNTRSGPPKQRRRPRPERCRRLTRNPNQSRTSRFRCQCRKPSNTQTSRSRSAGSVTYEFVRGVAMSGAPHGVRVRMCVDVSIGLGMCASALIRIEMVGVLCKRLQKEMP